MVTQENHPPGGPIGKYTLTIQPFPITPYSVFRMTKFLTNILFPGSDHNTQSGLDPKKAESSPAVRFASVNEEIEPANVESLESNPPTQSIPGNEQEQLKELSKTLQSAHLQKRRMSHFDFEPVSLPASRVRLRPLSFLGIQMQDMEMDKGDMWLVLCWQPLSNIPFLR
jgi:hypothetical protein